MTSKYLNKFSKFLEYLTVITFLILVSLIIFQMSGRYLGLTGIGWTDEMVSCATTWMVFLGTSYLTERGGHISVSLLEDSLHGFKKNLLNTFIQIVNIICGIGLSYSGYVWSMSTANKLTNNLQIRYNIWFIAVCVFGVLFTFFSIFKLSDSFKLLLGKDTSTELK
ncbi:MAG: TRAP transporter small permease [Clostridia bacterium]|nr:TRAP transporter small permease [Clostridia bacterium]